jgi:pimeloyl-ACP methyl ester carboxylesterase
MYSLPQGVNHRQVNDVNGLSVHVLEAGQPENPCIALLHGFPDLAYGWRHVMPRLSQAGYYVIAPDQRGYGGTKGWTANYSDDIRPFGMQNLVLDLTCLLSKLSIRHVHCLVGHDFGSPVAAYATLFRPDLFARVMLMSAPFPGAPKPSLRNIDLDVGLGDLDPPRKHYQAYNASALAEADMLNCKQGLFDFMRGYFHMKSDDWSENQPHPLSAWQPNELAKMPGYYVMPRDKTMPEVVMDYMPSEPASWLTDEELQVFVQEFERTGFQGALNWYRCSSDATLRNELSIFFDKKIGVPCWYLAGAEDWGTYQTPGALERLATNACADFRGQIMIPSAGHWVQQEQAKLTFQEILKACNSPA